MVRCRSHETVPSNERYCTALLREPSEFYTVFYVRLIGRQWETEAFENTQYWQESNGYPNPVMPTPRETARHWQDACCTGLPRGTKE